MLNVGDAPCPAKYPERALYGISASMVNRRMGAPAKFINAFALNFFRAWMAFVNTGETAFMNAVPMMIIPSEPFAMRMRSRKRGRMK